MKFQYHNMGYDMDETYTPSIFERAKNITKGIGQGFQKAFAPKEGGTDVGNFMRSIYQPGPGPGAISEDEQ